jgi:hypothetical protein
VDAEQAPAEAEAISIDALVTLAEPGPQAIEAAP